MAYSSEEDVQRLIKWITFSQTSKLTTSDIQQMIVEADAQIDGLIGTIYEVPVTHEQDKKILTYASARLAAYEAAKVLIVQAGGELPSIVEGWKASADDYIAMIQRRNIVLENTARRQIVSSSGLYSRTADDPEASERKWYMDKEQW